MRSITAILLAMTLLGCAHQASDGSMGKPPVGAAVGNKAKAIAIAKAAVSAKEPLEWFKRSTYEAEWRNGGWSVMVWTKPTLVGDFRIVRVDANGNITDYVVGR